jgi:hypothetical protein
MQLDEQTFEHIVGGGVRLGSFTDEQRAADRVPISRKAQCAELLADGTHGKRMACHIREVSRRGAGLLINADVAEESALVLWLPDRKGDELAIECGAVRVAPCAGNTSMVSLGVVFLREYAPPPAGTARQPAPTVLKSEPATPEEEAVAIKAIRDAMFS